MHSNSCSITLSEWKAQSSNKRGNKRVAEMFAMVASLRITDYRSGCSAGLHSLTILRGSGLPAVT